MRPSSIQLDALKQVRSEVDLTRTTPATNQILPSRTYKFLYKSISCLELNTNSFPFATKKHQMRKKLGLSNIRYIHKVKIVCTQTLFNSAILNLDIKSIKKIRNLKSLQIDYVYSLIYDRRFSCEIDRLTDIMIAKCKRLQIINNNGQNMFSHSKRIRRMNDLQNISLNIRRSDLDCEDMLMNFFVKESLKVLQISFVHVLNINEITNLKIVLTKLSNLQALKIKFPVPINMMNIRYTEILIILIALFTDLKLSSLRVIEIETNLFCTIKLEGGDCLKGAIDYFQLLQSLYENKFITQNSTSDLVSSVNRKINNIHVCYIDRDTINFPLVEQAALLKNITSLEISLSKTLKRILKEKIDLSKIKNLFLRLKDGDSISTDFVNKVEVIQRLDILIYYRENVNTAIKSVVDLSKELIKLRTFKNINLEIILCQDCKVNHDELQEIVGLIGQVKSLDKVTLVSDISPFRKYRLETIMKLEEFEQVKEIDITIGGLHYPEEKEFERYFARAKKIRNLKIDYRRNDESYREQLGKCLGKVKSLKSLEL